MMKKDGTKEKEVVKHLVSKMLEPHGVDYDYVKKHPIIKGKDWFNYYTFLSEEHEKDFQEYAIDYLMKNLKFDRKKAEYEYSWFNLAFGLKSFKNENLEKDSDQEVSL